MAWPKGRPRDPETKEKISKGNKGLKRSEEFVLARKLQAQSETARANFQLCLEASRSSESRNKATQTLLSGDGIVRLIENTIRVHTGKKRSKETRERIKEFQSRNSDDKSLWMKKFWDSQSPEQRRNITANGVRASRRANPTSIEIMTREYLLSRDLEFLEQEPIGPYLVDFLLPNEKIVIECDGEYWHGSDVAKAKDLKRDTFLIESGYLIARLPEKNIRRQDFNILESVLC